jgi:hypothetical protein
VDLHTLDILLRIIQVVVLPVTAFLVKLLIDQRRQVNGLASRLTKAEACLENVPTEKTLHELALTIRGLGGDLHVAVEKIEGMGRIVDRLERVVSRHEEHLLNGGK